MASLDDQLFDNSAYNTYILTRSLPKLIIDYLIDNAPNLWKLLKYHDINPFDKEDVSIEDKRKMICKENFNTENYNILLQKYTIDALLKSENQVRVFIDDITSYNRTNALVRVIFQIIVHNQEMVITSPVSDIDKRDVAIMQTLVECLNGVKIPKAKSQLFIDYTQDRYSGAKQVSYNSHFSGFELSMGVWI